MQNVWRCCKTFSIFWDTVCASNCYHCLVEPLLTEKAYVFTAVILWGLLEYRSEGMGRVAAALPAQQLGPSRSGSTKSMLFFLVLGIVSVFGVIIAYDSHGRKAGMPTSLGPFRGLSTLAGVPVRGANATRAELGRAGWHVLHRMAAAYDKEPTPEAIADMQTFFRLWGQFYACSECAAHFREMLAAHPVDARSNRHLSIWLCEVHNMVNERLGKPAFPCTIEALSERWGSCGCFEGASSTLEGGGSGDSNSGSGGGGS